MSIRTQLKPLTVEEYLEGELRSDVKHELIGGQTYAMVGASRYHVLIAATLVRLLGNHLAGSPCRTYVSDMKVRIGDDFYYPDVLVSCTTGGHDYYETAPVLIVEVLSPTTERQDRLEKRLAYQRLPSLKEYVLIAQDKMQAEVYRPIEGGWELERYGQDDELRLESVDLTVSMTEIYEDVMSAP
jgi:Uma2 family endonuclease